MKSTVFYSITAALLSAAAVLAQTNPMDSSSRSSLSGGSNLSGGSTVSRAQTGASYDSMAESGSRTPTGLNSSPDSRLSTANSGSSSSSGQLTQGASTLSQGTAPVTRPATPPSAPAQEEEEEEEGSSGATPFYINAPLSGVTYTKGSIATLKWINGINEPVKVIVLAGEEAKSMQPTKYSFVADGSKGEYKWTIPESIMDGTYSFQLNFADKKNGQAVSQEAYSDQFKIVSAGGSTTKSRRSIRRRRIA